MRLVKPLQFPFVQLIKPLQFLPIGLFGSTVAIAGLANALKQGTALFGLPAFLAAFVTTACWLLFLALLLGYSIKYVWYRRKVAEELAHPVTANFLGTFFISAVLLASLSVPFSLTLARCVWLAATAGGSIFVYVMTSRSFRGNLDVSDDVPPTLIPGLTVMNAVPPGAVLNFGRYGKQVDTFLFSIGIVYTLTFFVVIAYRLAHNGPITPFLRPSLLLMTAPFEVGFLSYLALKGSVDLFASVIFYFGLFLFIVLFFHVFNKRLRFAIPWWGACFSTAALTNASLRYANLCQDGVVRVIGGMLLILLTGLVVITLWHTLQRLLRRELFSAVKDRD